MDSRQSWHMGSYEQVEIGQDRVKVVELLVVMVLQDSCQIVLHALQPLFNFPSVLMGVQN